MMVPSVQRSTRLKSLTEDREMHTIWISFYFSFSSSRSRYVWMLLYLCNAWALGRIEYQAVAKQSMPSHLVRHPCNSVSGYYRSSPEKDPAAPEMHDDFNYLL